MMNATAHEEPLSFEDHEEAWFAGRDRHPRRTVRQEQPTYTPGVDDSIADRWFR